MGYNEIKQMRDVKCLGAMTMRREEFSEGCSIQLRVEAASEDCTRKRKLKVYMYLCCVHEAVSTKHGFDATFPATRRISAKEVM